MCMYENHNCVHANQLYTVQHLVSEKHIYMQAYPFCAVSKNHNLMQAYCLYFVSENRNSMQPFLLYVVSKNCVQASLLFVCCVWKLFSMQVY